MVIYKTTNLINGKIYIGKDRKNDSDYYGWKILKMAIKKYGKEKFEKIILEKCKTDKDLCNREKYWIKKYKSQDKKIGYNICGGGEGRNGKHTEETKIKLSLKMRGIIKTKETRMKLSIALKGRKRTKQQIENHRLKIMGRKHTKEHKEKISRGLVGTHKNIEYRLNAQKGALKRYSLSKDIENKICDLYTNKVKKKEIEEKLKVSYYKINKVLINYGLVEKINYIKGSRVK